MKKINKGILLVASFLLVLGLVPVSAMAKTNNLIAYSQETDNETMSEVQKVAAANAAASSALQGYTATNATSKQDLTNVMINAINNAGITHVSVSWHGGNDFAKTDATESAPGKISGQVDFISGSRFASLTVNVPIAMLEPQPTPVPTPKPTPVPTPSATPTITPSATPTATPTVTPTATPSITPTVAPSAEAKLAATGENKSNNNNVIVNTNQATVDNVVAPTTTKEVRIMKISKKMLANVNSPMKLYAHAIQYALAELLGR